MSHEKKKEGNVKEEAKRTKQKNRTIISTNFWDMTPSSLGETDVSHGSCVLH